CKRLEALDLRWSQLTPHAKHALLWDSGAVSASEDSYVQVYVSCGMSMSDIAISKDSLGTVLPTTDCLGPHGVTYVRQVGAVASFGALDRLTRCTISDAPWPNSNATTSVVYSQDALLPSDIPSLRVVLHRDETGAARPAIHSFIDAATSTTLSCPLSPSNSNLLDQLNPSAALAKLDQVPSHLRLPFDSITTTQLVDTGIRCKVYFGRYNHKLVVAVKTITLDHVHDHEIVDAFAEEIRLMASFHHPNVVALLGFAWDSVSLGSLMAVTEYLSQGNLSRFLTDNPALHWDLKASLALDVARALQYLHSLLQPKVIHRDLKPKNILLDWPSAKLSGFGVSREAMDDETLTAGVGSALYMAPEALRSGYYSVSADMYSFGCVLCELDTQRPLYADIGVPAKRIMHLILEEGLVPAVTAACPPAIRALAHQCFHPDASLRPTAFDVARDLDLFVHGDVGGGLV
ncbi:hypothetical protein DYB36_011131, partial [Aphanomyces astaci]